MPNLSDPAGFTALNESGVAVGKSECCNPRHSKIHLYNASGASTVAEVMSGATFDALFFDPAINNSGAVAFGTYWRHFSDPPTREVRITRWFDGTSTTIVETTAGFTLLGDVQLNDAGDVAFQAYRYTDVGLEDIAIYRTDGTTITTIADNTGPLNIQQTFRSLAVNDSGAVAFGSRLNAGGEGIFVGDGGPLATVAIADPTTPFSGFETDIDINNQGTVAFTALLWDGSFGIYAGSDPVNDKVVQIGDYLFGQQVRGLGRPHLNNRGDIAFWFEVRDPRDPSGYWSGIALAVRESALLGDYNGDGTVDAADYVVWRKGLGTTYTQDDYNTWRANFGATLGSGSSSAFPLPPSPFDSAVPEPSAFVLAAMSAAGLLLLRLVGENRGKRGTLIFANQHLSDQLVVRRSG